MKLSTTLIALLISRVDLTMPRFKKNLNTFIDCPVLNKQAAELETVNDLEKFITDITRRLEDESDILAKRTMSTIIFFGLAWDTSPEGHSFWEEIYTAFTCSRNHSQRVQKVVHLCETLCYTDLVELSLTGFKL